MKGTMPVYYLYFKMISEKEELLSKEGSLTKAMKIIKDVEDQFKQYHDETLWFFRYLNLSNILNIQTDELWLVFGFVEVLILKRVFIVKLIRNMK